METYRNLIYKTFDFPNSEFQTSNDQLFFQGIDLMKIVQKYGTPLRLTYLPSIGHKISEAKKMFQKSFLKHQYRGSYTYTYCTKSSHFRFVIEETLKHGAQIETSSAFDLDIVKHLEKKSGT